jgi:hypothetical protein
MLGTTRRQGCKCYCQCLNERNERTSETVAAFDQEIQYVKNRLRDLVHRRNAILPIGRLPPEIISGVFVAYRKTMPLRDWPWQLIALTHVCSTWRSTARSFPSLWTVIDFSHPSLARENRSLSQPLPIIICSEVLKKSDWDQVFNLWPHSKKVDLDLYNETWSRELAEISSRPAPHLRSISYQLLVDWDEYADVEGTIIPGADVAPNLISVRLNFLTESLQGYKLRALNINTVNAPLWTTLRDVLASQEQLELLCLTHSLPVMAGVDMSYITQAPLRLTNLQFLKVKDNLDDMRMFLYGISLGPHTRIALTGDGAYATDGLLGLAEHIAARVKFIPDHPWLEVSFKCTRNECHFVVQTEGSEDELAISSLRGKVFDNNVVVDALNKFLIVIENHVRTLKIERVNPDILRYHFPRLAHVHTVEAVGPAADSVLAFLIADLRENAQDVSWPNLSHLKICSYVSIGLGMKIVEETLRERERRTGKRLTSLCLHGHDAVTASKDLAGSIRHGSYEDTHEAEKAVFRDVDFQAMVDQLVECQ